MNLYELNTTSLNWIGPIIHEYNDLGFNTVTSQPGKISKSEKNNYERRQKAYIRGYMNKNMANFVAENIKNPNLFVRTETHNKIIQQPECNCGSVIFINDKPGTNNFDDGDYEQSYNLSLPLRRPYDLAIENKMYDHYFPTNLHNQSEFDIMDMRWNNNDDLWLSLLTTIKLYHKLN